MRYQQKAFRQMSHVLRTFCTETRFFLTLPRTMKIFAESVRLHCGKNTRNHLHFRDLSIER